VPEEECLENTLFIIPGRTVFISKLFAGPETGPFKDITCGIYIPYRYNLRLSIIW
jgi:hypothetical protein